MAETLYRKYRPKSFKDVLGQEHIVKALEASIEKKAPAHAYLFAGSRGTGKTSVARIFAAELGCTPTDIFEIDAASNNSVEDIREIREAVNTLPYESPYKVYILDEAHMLSKSAWNALLKTLEEPPSHAIFILATTEIEKVPETVFSRCQTFTFKKPSQKILRDLVVEIAKGEGYTIDKASSELVAFLGDGSFRDTESILQKVISASKDKKLTIDEVELITGAPKGSLINKVIKGIEEGKSADSLSAIKEASEQNIDIKVFIKLLLERMRAVLLLRFAPDMKAEIMDEFGEEDGEFLLGISKAKGSKINSHALDEVLKAYEETNFAAIKHLPLELAVIRLSE